MIVAGRSPRSVVAPAGIDALAACVKALYADNVAFAFSGGGSALELGNVPRALDTVVQTTACASVVDYAPQDQTITLEAGMTLAAAAEVLAREGQFLAIDVADPESTTIGGAVATNRYGGRRLRYGSIKDTIVGVEIVRPDGIRARGGGKVVKNVAGFDMPKLMVGSLGSLGAIVNATFRVYPIAEARATAVFADVSGDDVMQLCRTLVADALEPAAVVAYGLPDGGRYECRVSFEGFGRGVEQQMQTVDAIAARLSLHVRAASEIDPSNAMDERERAVRRGSAWHAAISAQPSALARFLATRPFAPHTRHVVYPMLGSAFVAAETLDPAAIAQWRAALAPGTVVVTALPDAARADVETWGSPPAGSLPIMRRLKEYFDPKGLCNAGRYVGGL